VPEVQFTLKEPFCIWNSCSLYSAHRPVPLPLLTTYLNLQQNALTHDGYLSRINLEHNVFCLRCFVWSEPSSWSFLCKGKFISYLAHCSKLVCFTYRQPEHWST
jgi:hypothetical protein